MLSQRRRPLLAAVTTFVTLFGVVAALGGTAGAASSTPPAPQIAGNKVGITVSWEPTTKPVSAIPGQVTSGSFFVTNQSTTNAIPVRILPATAIPGNNGNLSVKSGADPRFPNISYSPNSFTAQPKTTTVVTVTVHTPANLSPGVYLVPAVVRPLPSGKGNVKVQQQITPLVTFQVPGKTEADVRVTFVGSGGDTSLHHAPGLPAIQLGTSGVETLRVLDDSPSSFYAYNEVTGTQSPFGNVVFVGHTVGEPGDLRHQPDLFFPHRYRDYPIVWSPSAGGIGVAHLSVSVGYHPTEQTLLQKSTSTSVLVISPLWALILAAYALLVLLGARRRAARQAAAPTAEPRRRAVAGRAVQVVASLVMAAIVVEAAFLSQPLALLVVGVVGAVAALAAMITGKGLDRPTMAHRLRSYQLVAAVLAVAGAVMAVLATVSSLAPDLAVGLLAGTGVWVALTWWLLWWNEERKAPAGPPPEADPPSTAEEPVPAVG